MADMTLSFAEPMLKQYYDKAMVENLVYADRPFFAMLKKKTDFVGDVQKLPLIYGNPQGASHDFSKALANKTNSKLKAFLISVETEYAVASVTNEVLLASSNDRGSFLSALTLEIDGAMQTVARRLSIASFRSGSGSIGRIASTQVAGNTVLVLANPDDIVSFEVGQALQSDTVDGGGTVSSTAVYVVAIDRDAGTFSVGATQGGAAITATVSALVADKYIFVDGDYDGKLKGLSAWLPSSVASNDSFFNVNRSSDKTRLAGVYIDGSALSVEEALIKAETRLSREGASPSHVFMNHTDWNRLKVELGTKIMYVDVKAGSEASFSFKGIMLNGSKGVLICLPDRDCPSGQAFMLQMSTWYLLSRGEPVSVFKADGQSLLRDVSSDSVTARIVSYAQMGCVAPGWNARILLR